MLTVIAGTRGTFGAVPDDATPDRLPGDPFLLDEPVRCWAQRPRRSLAELAHPAHRRRVVGL